MWRGYVLVEVTIALTGAQKIKVRDALLSLGTHSDGQPAFNTHLRARLDGQAAIVEYTMPAETTKAEIVAQLAADLGLTVAQMGAAATYLVSPGATWESRRQATISYIAAHLLAWGDGVT